MSESGGEEGEGALVAITGAAQGVGWAAACQLHEAGYRLLLLDRNPAVLNRAAELASGGRPVGACIVDVADEGTVRMALSTIVDRWGVPDVWVNNAGIGRWGPFDEGRLGGERAEMEVNYHGSVNCIRAMLPLWRARGGGHLIQITSSASLFHGPWMASYAASKAAIGSFVRALRVELRGSGIAVTEVIPNIVRTGMSEGANGNFVPRIATIRPELTPEQVAAAIQEAIERRPRELRLPRLITPFHIASAIAPRFVDWLLSWGPRGGR